MTQNQQTNRWRPAAAPRLTILLPETDMDGGRNNDRHRNGTWLGFGLREQRRVHRFANVLWDKPALVLRKVHRPMEIRGKPYKDNSDALSYYSRLLVAIDGSGSSLGVGEHTVRLARNLGAELFILAIVRMDWALRAGVHYRSTARELEWDSEFVAWQTEQLADESGIEHQCRLIRSCRPGRAITTTAEEIRASCIAIRSPGTSVLDRVLPGGIYREVIKHAECPVLVV